MRLWANILVVLVAALTAAPAGAGNDTVALPPGGVQVIAPGFTFHTPGPPWQTPHEGSYERDGAIVLGGTSMIFTAGLLADQNGDPVASANLFVKPVEWYGHRDPSRSPTENLLAYVKWAASMEDLRGKEYGVRFIEPNFLQATVNGAPCVRWEVDVEQPRQSAGKSEFVRTAMHRLLCSHPEFPEFAVEMTASEYHWSGSEPLVPEADRFAFFDSLRFTPLSHHTHEIPLAGHGWKLAAANGTVWALYAIMADRGTLNPDMVVARIDKSTDAVTARVPIGNGAFELTADARGAWVLDNRQNKIIHIDAATNTITGTIDVPTGTGNLTAGNGYLWVTVRSPGRMIRIDPKSDEMRDVGGLGRFPGRIAAADKSIFVSDEVENVIFRIDPERAEAVKRITAPSDPFILKLFDGILWMVQVEEGHQNTIVRIDPGKPESTPFKLPGPIPTFPEELAWWNGRLCVLGAQGAVGLIDPDQPDAVPEMLPIEGGQASDVLEANGSLWVAAADGIMRIEPK